MPTVLFIHGWRFFFYSNERNEPIHVHCKKAEKEAKFWLRVDEFEIVMALSYNMNSKDIRTVRQIIFQNFDLIVKEWNTFKKAQSL